MVIARLLLILFVVMCLPSLVYAKVSAHVDRSQIEEGETFQLMLQSDSEEPDLKKLEAFFEVLGTSRSSKVSIINGKMDRINEWIVTLAPKQVGIQTIPPIRFGNESTAPLAA